MKEHDDQNVTMWAPWAAFDVTRAMGAKPTPSAEAMAQAAHLPIQAMFQGGGAVQKMCSLVNAEMAAFMSRRTHAWSEAAGNACQCRNAQDAFAATSAFWMNAWKDQLATAQRIQAACMKTFEPAAPPERKDHRARPTHSHGLH